MSNLLKSPLSTRLYGTSRFMFTAKQNKGLQHNKIICNVLPLASTLKKLCLIALLTSILSLFFANAHAGGGGLQR